MELQLGHKIAVLMMAWSVGAVAGLNGVKRARLTTLPSGINVLGIQAWAEGQATSETRTQRASSHLGCTSRSGLLGSSVQRRDTDTDAGAGRRRRGCRA